MLYFAYGMNTHAGSMAQRCPAAQSLGHARLLNHAFRFATHILLIIAVLIDRRGIKVAQ
jgi:hypothetical protein